MSDKLRIGVLLDDYCVPGWLSTMLTDIVESDHSEIVLVIKNGGQKQPKPISISKKAIRILKKIPMALVNRFSSTVYNRLIEKNLYVHNAFEESTCKPILIDVPSITVSPKLVGISEYFTDEAINTIESYNLDVIIRCGFNILRGKILQTPRSGVWSFHHGDNRINRGGPAGFWESMEDWPEMGTILQVLSEDLDNGLVLYRSYSRSMFTVTDTKSSSYWKTLSFIPRKLKELHELGHDEFFRQAKEQNAHPVIYSNQLYRVPRNFAYFKLVMKKFIKKLKLIIRQKLYWDQWILCYDLRDDLSTSLWRYKWIIPPKDRFWADPHIIKKNDTYFIFIEEYMYDVKKGHISVIEMSEDGRYNFPQKVLETKYHLSYPFVFKHENKYYMIPETADNKTIELYRCLDFPNKWEFVMNLMDGVTAVDTTLLHHDNKWWLFANMVEKTGASSCDELFIFYADDFMTNQWTPHLKNPVISDCKSSRPAGRFFTHKGRLYRPNQNCSNCYGYGFNFAEVLVLNEAQYQERLCSKAEPKWHDKIIATHTFNFEDRLHTIDAMYRRRKYFDQNS